MKWGCVASLELLRHLQAKISFQSDWSHMWRRNNVLEAANAELLGIKKKKSTLWMFWQEQVKLNQQRNTVYVLFVGAESLKRPQLPCFSFLRRWRFQNFLLPKSCWKDQHLLRTHVQIIMCGSWKKKRKTPSEKGQIGSNLCGNLFNGVETLASLHGKSYWKPYYLG